MESTSVGFRDIPCSQPKLALSWKHITYHNSTAISMCIYQCLQATNWGNFREKQGIWRKNRESFIKTQPLGRYQMESTNLSLRKRQVFLSWYSCPCIACKAGNWLQGAPQSTQLWPGVQGYRRPEMALLPPSDFYNHLSLREDAVNLGR